MGGEDDFPDDGEASRRREEGCRREEAIRDLLKRHDDKRLSIGAVDEVAQELGVSRSTMYRKRCCGHTFQRTLKAASLIS
jgi:putative transposase